jgi:hypothetical protein
MAERRHETREKSELKCVLSFEDGHFIGEVKDISLSGVLVRPNTHIGSVHVGDKCLINIGGESGHRLVCEIVRLDGFHIGVKVI